MAQGSNQLVAYYASRIRLFAYPTLNPGDAPDSRYNNIINHVCQITLYTKQLWDAGAVWHVPPSHFLYDESFSEYDFSNDANALS